MVVTGMIDLLTTNFVEMVLSSQIVPLTPKLQTVKHLYSNIKIAVDEKSVTIKNDNVFEDLSAYTFLARVYEDGRKVSESEYHFDVKPGEEATFPVEFRCWSFKC